MGEANSEWLSISEIQTEELRLLNVFADYCEAQDLRYYIGYGTLLGAVRHGGFIPWDDDVDVLMPRKDYDRFCEFAPKLLDSFTLAPFEQGAAAFAKLISTRTRFYEEGLARSDSYGIFLDIFPLDGVKGNACRKRFRLVNYLTRLYGVTYGLDWSHRSLMEPRNLAKWLVSKIGKCVPRSELVGMIESLMRKVSIEGAEYVLNFQSPYPFERDRISASALGGGGVFNSV